MRALAPRQLARGERLSRKTLVRARGVPCQSAQLCHRSSRALLLPNRVGTVGKSRRSSGPTTKPTTGSTRTTAHQRGRHTIIDSPHLLLVVVVDLLSPLPLQLPFRQQPRACTVGHPEVAPTELRAAPASAAAKQPPRSSPRSAERGKIHPREG